jgi:hypothetical protein
MGLESKVVEDVSKDNEPQIDREKVFLWLNLFKLMTNNKVFLLDK